MMRRWAGPKDLHSQLQAANEAERGASLQIVRAFGVPLTLTLARAIRWPCCRCVSPSVRPCGQKHSVDETDSCSMAESMRAWAVHLAAEHLNTQLSEAIKPMRT